MRDLDDTSPLGFLVMNIKEKSIAQAYANLPAQDSFQVAVLDEHLQVIASNSTAPKESVPAISEAEAFTPAAQKQAGIHSILEANKAELKQAFQERPLAP